MQRLQDKVVLVTGGNTGIGKAVVERFCELGARIAIGWHEAPDAARSLVDDIVNSGQQAFAHELDVTREDSVTALVEQTLNLYGSIDVLINNAGVQKAQPIVDMSVNDWDHMLAVHLRGAFLCSKAVTTPMIAQGSGRIINVCSQLGVIGREHYTAYSAAKGGTIAFTRALAKELAPHGILVNGVAPGLVDTGFDPLPDDVKRAHAERLPLKRLGTPEDMTSAFEFLASEDGRYYCGQILHPNGGEIMP